MPAIYGSTTVNYLLSKGNAKAAQDMIGTSSALRVNAGGEMQNGHIGAAEHMSVPPARAQFIAAQDTPGIDSNSLPIKWDLAQGIWVDGS